MPGGSRGRFTVELTAKVRNRPTQLGVYEYVYGDQKKLEEILRFGDEADPFPFRIERDLSVGPNRANTIFMGGGLNTPLRSWGDSARRFAIFSLSTRTANDSIYPGKPGRTSSFVHNVLGMDVTKAHPALLPMEMQLLPISVGGANVSGSIEADEADRAFYFSGTSRGTGAISHVSRDIPSGPMLNLADLRYANLTAGGRLPLTDMTVGESLAPAHVGSAEVVRNQSVYGYPVADQPWLSNNTLWDSFFFSAIEDEAAAIRLFEGPGLEHNPRLEPLLPAGLTARDAASKATSEEAWKSVGSKLAWRGGFNVNSTSVDAWKAMLSSTRNAGIPVLGPVEVNDGLLPIGNRVLSVNEAASFGYANPSAAAGDVEEGSTAVLTQADLLSALGTQLTVRSDTFVIRTYGDHRSGNRILARAWCEAVVQRSPDFIDPSDAPDSVRPIDDLGPDTLKPVNQTFGRRFAVISFRWLHREEI